MVLSSQIISSIYYRSFTSLILNRTYNLKRYRESLIKNFDTEVLCKTSAIVFQNISPIVAIVVAFLVKHALLRERLEFHVLYGFSRV